jgi:hypothetical protein
MVNFFFRHWTGTVVIAAIAGWTIFYLPASPSFAVFQLKRAVDARDGEAAARFVDFESVVKQAGDEIVSERGAHGDILGQLLGQSALAVLSQPLANGARAWVKQEVESGAQDVQIPAAALAGAVVMLHRDGDAAYTSFRDRKGQQWEVHMARDEQGNWQVVEVKNIRQILERLQRQGQPSIAAPR